MSGERGVRIVPVPGVMLAHVFKTGVRMPYECLWGVPPDAELIDVKYYFPADLAYLWFTSAEWAPVPEGEPIPNLPRPEFRNVEQGV